MNNSFSDFSEDLLGYLTEMAIGNCSITEEIVVHAAEEDETLAQILAGLLFLHETLLFQKNELKDAAESYKRIAEVKSQFLANMSHKIRTPMNGILGFSNLLLEKEIDEESHEFASMIYNSTQSLLTVVNDVLDFSKLESGKFNIESIPFNLRSVIKDVEDLFGHVSGEKEIFFGIEIDENIPQAQKGDPNRIRQVLINLVGNAVKFTEQGSVHLKINVLPNEGTKEGSDLYIFTIVDTGIGIADTQMSHLFKDFSQADGSISRRYGGTGLDLSISNKIVGLLGGDIEVTSEEGVGSQFTVKLSLEPAFISQKVLSNNLIRDYQKSVLVVDDNIVNLKLAQKTLSKLGIYCEQAKNGKEALDKLFENKFDLIIMDIQMPIMDGMTATKLIRKSRSLNYDTPIVALTANVMVEEQEIYKETGMNDILAKPFKKEQLVKLLDLIF